MINRIICEDVFTMSAVSEAGDNTSLKDEEFYKFIFSLQLFYLSNQNVLTVEIVGFLQSMTVCQLCQ